MKVVDVKVGLRVRVGGASGGSAGMARYISGTVLALPVWAGKKQVVRVALDSGKGTHDVAINQLSAVPAPTSSSPLP